MHAWTWLLVIALVVALVLCWGVSRELRDTRLRATRLTERVKRLRRLIMLDRLDRLERDIKEIEAFTLQCKTWVHDWDEGGASMASYAAACRSFVQRSTAEGQSRDHADAVARAVLGQLVRGDPVRAARLGQLLSQDERSRWLQEKAAE